MTHQLEQEIRECECIEDSCANIHPGGKNACRGLTNNNNCPCKQIDKSYSLYSEGQ